MANFNKVILMGRLTRDPELKSLPSGKSVTTIGLAVNNSYTGKDGNKVDDTLFIDVSIFGKQAESVNQYMKKGSGVLVDGRLKYRTWESEGNKHYKHDVVAQRILFTGNKSTSTASTQQGTDNEPMEDDDIPF